MSEKIPPQKRLYTVAEAAVYMGVTVWGMRGLIWNGLLPAVRDRRRKRARILIDVRDMDKYIEEHKEVEVGNGIGGPGKEDACGDTLSA